MRRDPLLWPPHERHSINLDADSIDRERKSPMMPSARTGASTTGSPRAGTALLELLTGTSGNRSTGGTTSHGGGGVAGTGVGTSNDAGAGAGTSTSTNGTNAGGMNVGGFAATNNAGGSTGTNAGGPGGAGGNTGNTGNTGGANLNSGGPPAAGGGGSRQKRVTQRSLNGAPVSPLHLQSNSQGKAFLPLP